MLQREKHDDSRVALESLVKMILEVPQGLDLQRESEKVRERRISYDPCENWAQEKSSWRRFFFVFVNEAH